MGIVPRSALTLVLVALAAFCGFGFLASFEDAVGALGFRWLFGAFGVACVLAVVALWWVRPAGRRA